MKNRERWVPSKFVYKNGRLRSSTIRANVGAGSRLMVDLIAHCYDVHLREYARGRLVDLGCGKVPLLRAYESLVDDIVCADWQNTIHRNDYLDTECDLTAKLPFADSEFDTAILSDVLEHIPEPQHLMGEIARILAPSGRLVMNVPFYYWLHETPYDYYRYTEYALRRLVESAGLKVLLLQPIGGVPEILADIIAKNVLFLPRVGPQLAILLQKMTFAFVGTKLGHRISRRTSESFPFGYFLVGEKPGAEPG
jgi:SAM-dependent methyltransferase